MTITQVAELLGISERTVQRKIVSGLLSPYNKKSGRKAKYRREDVLAMAPDILKNKAKHRPDTATSPPKPSLSKEDKREQEEEAIAKMLKKPTKRMMNNYGEQVLMNTTKILEDNGFLDNIDKSTIYRYAIAVQIHEFYLNKVAEYPDKYYFDLMAQQFRVIQHYEKELGLTPLALSKIKPLTKEEPVEVDPMEALINGD